MPLPKLDSGTKLIKMYSDLSIHGCAPSMVDCGIACIGDTVPDAKDDMRGKISLRRFGENALDGGI
jgi:hypothetical protein